MYKWGERKCAFKDVLNNHNGKHFDIVAFQEARHDSQDSNKDQLQFFDKFLSQGGRKYQMVRGLGYGKNGAEHCPIYFNTETLTLKDYGVCELNYRRWFELPLRWLVSITPWGGDQRRIFAWALFVWRETEILVTNTHFPWPIDPFGCKRAANDLIKKTDEHREHLLAIGDFNSGPFSRAHKEFEKSGLTRIDAGGKKTYHEDGNEKYCFDAIYAGKGWEEVKSGLIRDKSSNCVYPSDHFGVWACVRLKKKEIEIQ
jgi:endonuclease/exonuclease/phosphatase family metal-dependent hydrolase